jgi:preprotein translocase subunit SecG
MSFLLRILVNIASVFYFFICLLLILIVLVQKGKGSMGMLHHGGTSHALFGGSGGQDFFQKTTWFFGFIFIFGSLGLALLQARETRESHYIPSAVSVTPLKTDSAS